MKYYNLHTHQLHIEQTNVVSVVNVSIKEDTTNPAFLPTENYSIGIHPWHIEQKNLEENLSLLEQFAQLSSIKLIGECGLDKLCDTNFELQKSAFLSQIKLSEQSQKPLIIHCVKSFDELIQIKKDLKPQQAWIIHGFRGKPQQAIQLINQGFYLSLGYEFNSTSLSIIPKEKLFLETDDKNIEIQQVYKKVSSILNLSEEKLALQIAENFRKVILL